MTAKVMADLVIGIPYGDGAKKKWQKVGALLQMDPNDPAKGPGFVVMLDRTFNPAGAPASHDGNSVALSAYWTQEKGAALPTRQGGRHLKTFNGEDDDIPF